MRHVAPPIRIPIQDYDRATLAAEDVAVRARLTARRAEVEALYAEYARVHGRPHLVTASGGWGRDDVAAQKGVYDLTQAGRPLADLRGLVLGVAGARCLLCGAGRPATLDHVLPKSRHPALSILHLNLIGACDHCNRRKSITCLAEPEQQFVHPYFDVIPRDTPLLHATPLQDGALAPRFEIVDAPDVDAELTARLRWQVERLGLDIYYSDEAVLYCNEQALGWLELAAEGWPSLRDAIERDLRSVSRRSGRNTWRAALLSGLLDSEEFAEHCVQVLERLEADPAHPAGGEV